MGCRSARYLVRLAHQGEYFPKDAHRVATNIRKVLGSGETASHFRIATNALEFNLFAHNEKELESRKKLLEKAHLTILSVKQLDLAPTAISRKEALREGIALFNQERFWECHEILEQMWRVCIGSERESLQGLILTAAAFVHYQKGETEVCLSVLRRARAKMESTAGLLPVDLVVLRKNVDEILDSSDVHLFTLPTNQV